MAHGQTLPIQQIVDAKMRAVDTRLETSVTFDADRMYLGEALEKVSAQTGVSVSIPAEDPASGIPITCHVKNIPLADFMNSVWSLVSFPNATWQITVDLQQNMRRYQLLPTVASRALADRLSREAAQYSVDLVAVLLKMCNMTPKERQANAHQLAQAMLAENDDKVRYYVNDSKSADDYWAMIRAFATALTPDQQAQLLQGGTISLPLNSLDANTQATLRASIGHNYTESNGVRIEEPPPDTVRFSFGQHDIGNKYDTDSKQHLIRQLFIGVGNAHSFVSGTYLGGMQLGLKNRVLGRWILPGDLLHAATEKQVLSTLPDLPAASLWQHVAPFDRLLTQLAAAQSVSYIGVAPEDPNNQVDLPFGKSVELCLEELRRSTGVMHKWRDGVLLFNYSVWFYGDEAQYPYAVVKQLRESKQRHIGTPLTLPEIADDVITLSLVQMKRLAKEFPQIKDNRIKRPIFVFYKKYPGTLSEEGLTADLNMVAMLKELKLMPPLLEKDALKKIRILEKALPQARDDRRFYRLQFQTTQQKAWQEIDYLSILP